MADGVGKTRPYRGLGADRRAGRSVELSIVPPLCGDTHRRTLQRLATGPSGVPTQSVGTMKNAVTTTPVGRDLHPHDG